MDETQNKVIGQLNQPIQLLAMKTEEKKNCSHLITRQSDGHNHKPITKTLHRLQKTRENCQRQTSCSIPKSKTFLSPLSAVYSPSSNLSFYLLVIIINKPPKHHHASFFSLKANPNIFLILFLYLS